MTRSTRRAPLAVFAPFVILGALGVVAAGCGGDKSAEATNPAPKTAAAEPDDSDPPVSSEGKKWGGWRWKGNRKKCYFVHKNKCFRTEERACRAAGCAGARCVVGDGAPAKVSCRRKNK